MTAEEYLGKYYQHMDTKELSNIMNKLNILYRTKSLCPSFSDVFKAFKLCPYDNLKVIMLGQDPYPQKGVATGLAFANKTDTKVLSPSLRVLKESVIDLEVPHNFITFAPDLEDWAKQGVLLLNSALTVETNKAGSHSLMWRPFISHFLYEVSLSNPGLIYVLFGKQAQSFKRCINNGIIIESPHPSYYARNNERMPHSVFVDIDSKLKYYWNTTIEWYKEFK